jgi:uncharacterized repeat protein (TIGR01451 family)
MDDPICSICQLFAGSTITYVATITNNGNCKINLTSTTITLPTGEVVALTCGDGTVARGGSVRCTPISFRVTAATYDEGVLMQATADATAIPSAALTATSAVELVVSSSSWTTEFDVSHTVLYRHSSSCKDWYYS